MRKTFVLTLILTLAVASGAFAAGVPAPNALGIGEPQVHAGQGDALTLPSEASPVEIVAGYLAPHHPARTFETLIPTAEYQLEVTGLTHLRMKQHVDGLTVHGAYLKAAVNEHGELVHVIDNLVAPPADGVQPAGIAPADALDTALEALHPWLARIDQAVTGQDGNTTLFADSKAFWRGPRVTRVAVPMADGSMQEGFLVETWTDRDNLLHHTLVGGDGELLDIQLRTAVDSYNIFPDHPGNSSQTIVAGPGSGNTESPVGWLFSGDHSSVDIAGNNVHAYLDTDANNSPDSGGVTISDGNFVSVADLTQDPSILVNQEVAVQNLFYLNNVIHDKLYRHGFVESVGNFQEDNFGNGGSGSDSVNAEAQDGSGLNNANFATPSDGSNPRMQMFLWDQTVPRRDGDVDSDIPWHEYGHGLTWRMIGSMSGAMSGAIGEGNSDVLSIFTNDNDVVGEYSFADPNGIRSEPYTGYSRTYGDFGGSSVHFDGEIYAAIMWDLKTRYADNGIPLDTLWDDMVGGMNFTPSGPDFEAMRDGILQQAATSRDCFIWESFAKFGVGVNATNDISCNFFGCSGSITEDFSVPAECNVVKNPPTVTITAPADGSTFQEGTAITFTGTASDTEDGDLSASISWSSDIDGALGTGSSITTTLSVGTHVVTASVIDSDTNTASDSISVTVQGDQPPVVSIDAPADGSTFASGTSISFSGTATDNEDGDLTAGLSWSSDIDGAIGSGGSFNAVLSDGTHVVTASVTDSAGNTGSDSITVTVGQSPLTLSATGDKVRGRHEITLNWSGGSGSEVDVFRDGVLIATTPNDGNFLDQTGNNGKATYQHQVCDAGTTNCSNVTTTSF